MANIKSAKKRISVTARKTLINRMRKSMIKTAIKRFEMALAEGNMEASARVWQVAEISVLRVENVIQASGEAQAAPEGQAQSEAEVKDG